MDITADPGVGWPASALFALHRRGRAARPPLQDGRRFVIVHVDGLSWTALERAIAGGYMPNLAAAIDRGELSLRRTWAGTPASTPAFQSALFYGERGDVPGFLWYDRRRRVSVRMDDPAEALRLEQWLAGRRTGILEGGSAYFTIVSGGAAPPQFCASSLVNPSASMGGIDEKNAWDHLASALAHGLPAVRAVASLPGRGGSCVLDSALWALHVRRLKHEPMFLRNRVLFSTIFVDLATQLLLLDIARGVPCAYACYVGYDEVGHRRGPYSTDAFEELVAADRSIAEIQAAIRARPELRYELYVLSDHGQEPTVPLESVLGGGNLADWILAADRGGRIDVGALGRRARERVHRERLRATPLLSRLCAGRTLEGGGDEGRPPLTVVDAGDLAHVYLGHGPAPLELSAIQARFPGALRAAIDCPGSGIVAVRGGAQGFAFVRGRRLDLAERGSLRGVLSYDAELLRAYLADMLTMPSAGDLVVYGAGVRGGDVAYAWEFGSHGGVGRGDVETFLLHPWFVSMEGEITGPLDLHRFFRERFLDRARDAFPATAASPSH